MYRYFSFKLLFTCLKQDVRVLVNKLYEGRSSSQERPIVEAGTDA